MNASAVQAQQGEGSSVRVQEEKVDEHSITYALSLWSTDPSLPMIETAPRLPHTLLFVPGLKDTFGTVPYMERLAIAIAPLGFNVVQPQLTSTLGGYGVSSLEADAQEIALVMRHLRTRKRNAKHPNAKVVVMGHSTGCQDMAQLLTFDRPGVSVDGVILQAPVSDREDFERAEPQDSEARKTLEKATELVNSGKGAQLLPRNHTPPRRARNFADKIDANHRVNADAVGDPAITAYRFWSLNARGGDDDFFSTDLDDKNIEQLWKNLLGADRFVAALLGADDEYGPTTTNAAALAEHWSSLVAKTLPNDAQRFRATAVPGANHKVEDATAQRHLVSEVYSVLLKVLGEEDDYSEHGARLEHAEMLGVAQNFVAHNSSEGPARGKEPYPASFDQVVELISTGRADSIPGIKDIPLQLNETSPSEACMERPLKPWERAQQ